MPELIKSKAHKAKFDRHDDSAEFIIEAMDWIRHARLSFHELRAIAKLKSNNWNIKKGEVYVQQFCKKDGYKYTFRTLPKILRICIKYKLYGD